jgi:hypothetical protein
VFGLSQPVTNIAFHPITNKLSDEPVIIELDVGNTSAHDGWQLTRSWSSPHFSCVYLFDFSFSPSFYSHYSSQYSTNHSLSDRIFFVDRCRIPHDEYDFDPVTASSTSLVQFNLTNSLSSNSFSSWYSINPPRCFSHVGSKLISVNWSTPFFFSCNYNNLIHICIYTCN